MKRLFLIGILSAILAGCAAAQSQSPEPRRAALENFGPAPELTNSVWINADRPLRLADLRGKVVLLDMWTFG